ncbi:MAG: hypothetical protein JXR10_06115 [Cyclobacteriaceae bacterium]
MRLFVFLSLLFLGLATEGQDLIISKVSFEGLRRTNPEYLQSFLTLDQGQTLDWDLLEMNRQRLANLEILSDVQVKTDTLPTSVHVTYECKELFSHLPIASFGGIKENFWLQLGATDVNVFGRGYKAYLAYQYYDRHSVSAHLNFDWIKGSNWGLNLNFVKWGTLEPLYFSDGVVSYNYDNYTYGVDGVYHFGFRDKILFGASYFTEEYEAASELVAGAPAYKLTRKTLFKLMLDNDYTNWFYYFREGFAHQLHLQSVYSLDGYPDFYIAFNDLKYYERVGKKGNFASRLRMGIATNQDSPFAPFVLDSYLNIRGVGNRVDRGSGSVVLNLEYRHSFIDRDKLAIQGVAFSDLGTWRNPGGEFKDFIQSENVKSFAGLGVRFIHKEIFNATLRLDYGVDLQSPDRNGFVIGVGQYF